STSSPSDLYFLSRENVSGQSLYMTTGPFRSRVLLRDRVIVLWVQLTSSKVQAEAMAASAKAAPGRTVGEQVAEWKTFLHAACQAGQMSEGRYDAYCRNIGIFVAWAGPGTAIGELPTRVLGLVAPELPTRDRMPLTAIQLPP